MKVSNMKMYMSIKKTASIAVLIFCMMAAARAQNNQLFHLRNSEGLIEQTSTLKDTQYRLLRFQSDYSPTAWAEFGHTNSPFRISTGNGFEVYTNNVFRMSIDSSGRLRFAGIANDTTKSRILVSDSLGNLYYRNLSSLVFNSNTNVNTGSGFRMATAGTNNIKSLFSGYGGSWDSTSNSNALTYTIDSTKFIPYTDTAKPGGLATQTYVNSQGFLKTAVTTVGTFSSVAQANGATIAGNTITYGPADTTKPGMINTGSQYFAGTKTFTSLPAFSLLTAGSIPFAGTGGAISQNNSGLFWDNTNGRLGINTNTFNAVSGVQINTNFNGPYGLYLTNTNTGSNYASASIGLGLDPGLPPFGTIGVLNGNFPVVGILHPYGFVIGAGNGGGATSIVSAGGGTMGGYILFGTGGSYIESMRLTPSRRLLIGDVVENSTGLVQITSSTAQFALHYDPTHYTNFTTSSAGRLTINPSGVTTTFVAPTSSAATLNLPAGTFPSSPSSGDLGHTSGHLYFRDGSTTYDLLAASTEWTISGSNISNASGTNVGIGTTTPLSNLDVAGSFSANYVAVSANYTVLSTDYTVYVTNGSSSVTITLPAASGDNRRIYNIARGSGSTGTITIATNGGNVEALSGTMGSTTTLAALGSYGSKTTFQSNGTNYVRIGN